MISAVLLILIPGGVFAGVLSSLFGLGGGLVVVPLLYWFFHFQKVPLAIEMHLAVGTSLAVMLVTTANTIYFRMRQKQVVMSLWKFMFPWIAVSSILGGIAATALHSTILKWIFILFLLGIILRGIFKKKFHPTF